VRGRPAPMTRIWAPGCGTEAFWPIFDKYLMAFNDGLVVGVVWLLISGWLVTLFFFGIFCVLPAPATFTV
jgi:hypothetical protein